MRNSGTDKRRTLRNEFDQVVSRRHAVLQDPEGLINEYDKRVVSSRDLDVIHLRTKVDALDKTSRESKLLLAIRIVVRPAALLPRIQLICVSS
jgi:hypothetical protein